MRKAITLFIKCFKIVSNKTGLFLSWTGKVILAVITFISSYYLSALISSVIEQSLVLKDVFGFFSLLALQTIIEIVVFIQIIYFEKCNRVKLKGELLNKLFSLSPGISELKNTSKNTEILYSETNAVTSFLISGWNLVMDCLMVFFAAMIVFSYSMFIFMWIIISILIYALLTLGIRKRIRNLNKTIRDETDKNYKFVRDVIMNYKVIYLNDAASFITQKFSEHANLIKDTTIRRENTSLGLNISMKVMNGITVVFILLFFFRNSNTINGSFVFLLACSRILFSSLTRLITYATSIHPQLLSIERFLSLFNLSTPTKGQKVLQKNETLELKNISFCYGGKPLFNGFSTEFTENGIYVIKGINGSGKTTLLNLIAGICKPIQGEVIWNGGSLLDYDYGSIIEQISYCPQTDSLFNMTLSENILLKSLKEIDPHVITECKELLRLLNLDTVIELKESTISSSKISDGQPLSLGQIKKVCLIRMLLRNSSILLLDEPLNGLDDKSRLVLCEYLDKLSVNKKIIIATNTPIFCNNIKNIVSLS